MVKLMLATWFGVFMGFGIAAVCQASGRGREEEEMQELLKRKRAEILTTEEEILHVPDGAGFVGMTENPFRHGCCDCGLWHTVEWALADREGNEIPAPEGAILALKFMRDVEGTKHFREHSKDVHWAMHL